MFKKTVSIHAPARKSGSPSYRHIDEGLARWGRAELGMAISDYGLDLVYTRGQGAFDLDKNIATVLRPNIEKDESGLYVVTVKPAEMAATGISAIRNITRVISNEHNSVPELNHPSVRTATRNKAVSNNLFGPYAKNSAVIEGHADLHLLDQLSGDSVVIKPVNGMRSENVHMLNKTDVAELLSVEREKPIRWIAEERIDFSAPMPVRGLTPADQEMIDYANSQGLPKELRTYTFGRDAEGKLITSHVLRTVGTGETRFGNDFWVYVDEDSIPDEVVSASGEVYDTFARHTGVDEMHLGIDWVYATEPGADGTRWMVMEANGGEPQLVYEEENEHVARDQSHKLAAQLHRIAMMH